MNGKLSIIISVILVTAAILTVQSPSSMLQISYAQSCPDGSTPDASGNCPTLSPPAGEGETQAPPAGDGETAEAPPATETPPPAAPPATATPPPAAPPANASQGATNNESRADYVNTI